jgi:hypothetical protein
MEQLAEQIFWDWETGYFGLRDLNCVELTSTLDQYGAFDRHSLMAEINCIPISLCLYK